MSRKAMPEVEIFERFDGLQKLSRKEKVFLDEKVIPDYIFFSKKENRAYCTYCGEDMAYSDVKGIRAGEMFKCPKCGHMVKGRNFCHGHNFSDSGTGVIIHRLGEDMILRYYDVWRSYVKDYRKPYIMVREKIRDVVHSDGTEEMYDCTDRWRNVLYTCTYSSGWHYAFHTSMGRSPLCEDYVSIYTGNLDEVLKGTRYEHSELKKFAENCNVGKDAWAWGRYLGKYEKTPMWEYLMKMGMFSFAEKLWKANSGWGRIQLDHEQKTLQGMLMITRPQLAELQSTKDADVKLLLYMRAGYGVKEWREYGEYMDADDYARFAKAYRFNAERFRKYADAQSLKSGRNTRDYIDYLDMCVKLGYDMRNTFIAFPKHLHEAHDAAKDVFNKRKVEILNVEYLRVKEGLERQFKYRKEDMSIVVPQSTMDISKEGQNLHHCVGTYIDRVCREETAILFIRSNDNLGKSFYTMEVKDGRIVQCRGMGNCDMTDDVKKFVASFCKAKHISMGYMAA